VANDFLAMMAESSHERALQAEAQLSREQLAVQIAQLPSPPRLQLSVDGFDLIAEVKLRSPAAGRLRDPTDTKIAELASVYAEAGAAAISILTEPLRFDGELVHLKDGADAIPTVPAMRKDFLINSYQVLEARAAGAGGVLLIVRMLSSAMLEEMVRTALQQELFVLLEVFDEHDVDRARPILDLYRSKWSWDVRQPRILMGVNCRDLVSLQVVPDRLLELVDRLPQDLPKVAESGLEHATDAAALARAGYDLALVGSALMRSASPARLVQDLLSAGRAGHARLVEHVARGQHA
jgi:indole-3-glycerol phosphate synthase